MGDIFMLSDDREDLKETYHPHYQVHILIWVTTKIILLALNAQMAHRFSHTVRCYSTVLTLPCL